MPGLTVDSSASMARRTATRSAFIRVTQADMQAHRDLFTPGETVLATFDGDNA